MPQLVPPVIPPGALAGSPQPVIRAGGGLVLRPWRASDAPAVAAAYADPDIRQWHVRTMDQDEARAWIHSWTNRWAQETGCGWAVTSPPDVLGQVGLRNLRLAQGLAEISYWVRPAARRRGVATTGVIALTGWALRVVGLHRLELHHSVANPVSCRVADRCGYVLEGTKRSEGLHTDGWHDMHLHARIDEGPPEAGQPKGEPTQ